MTPLSLDRLRAFGIAVYEAIGIPTQDATIVVDVQLTADARGVDTHGFQRLPWYVGYVERGENNPKPAMTVVKQTPVSVLLDADSAIGQLACTRLMELTLEKARATGLAIGVSRNSNDWGCGAVYPLMAARQGYVCFGTTTSVPNLAPFGSRTKMLGNNPIVIAAPRRDADPLCLDMALTPVAIGKVLRANAEGTEIPLDWGFRDRDGVPTTDPRTALAGIMPAIGGYKGIGMAVMTTVLAGALPQGFVGDEVAPGKRGQCFWVVSPELFGERDEFIDRVEKLCSQLAASERLPGEQVYVPGEIEARRERETRERGTVDYPASVIEGLRRVGQAVGVSFPD